MTRIPLRLLVIATASLLALPGLLLAQDPPPQSDFDRAACTFTSTGSNPYFPLWPGYVLTLEGEDEDDEGETVEIEVIITVTSDTETVDGVETRVVQERESEDGDLVEVSRNFLAVCRETGDVWYFGEDVDDYEDGEVVGHGGAWRAGIDGAMAGILMPGNPIIGSIYYQEVAPGVAEDYAETVSHGATLEVPVGTLTEVMKVEEGTSLDPEQFSEKYYAYGVGLVWDDGIELTEVTPPPCLPDDTTLCLDNGRFQVRAEWEVDADTGDGMAILPSADSGEFWFFNPGNTELLVKVLDGCGVNQRYWVFAAGLTNVDVTLTVTDTQTALTREYGNDLGNDFAPILDTAAFATCP